ncbi:MAG TPA: hypothetical protein VE378_04765 [Nitrososphaeraceae archaeon]|nr:hypothetical protein [Nitrososphaeraceae archaeon]
MSTNVKNIFYIPGVGGRTGPDSTTIIGLTLMIITSLPISLPTTKKD